MLDNTPNQPSKFRAKNWVERNDDSHETYNTNSQIKFKTIMLNSSLCGCSDACIFVKGAITNPKTAAEGQPANTISIEVVFGNCAPFTDYISEINNTQVDNAKDNDKVMLMYNLLEYSDNYSKTSGSLWQCYRGEPSSGPDLDLSCVWQLDVAPFCENYAKLYFDAKHLEKGLNRGWWNFWCLFLKKWPF